MNQRRWGPCPFCGTEGWETIGQRFDPRRDHDRPDGRRCKKAAEHFAETDRQIAATLERARKAGDT